MTNLCIRHALGIPLAIGRVVTKVYVAYILKKYNSGNGKPLGCDLIETRR